MVKLMKSKQLWAGAKAQNWMEAAISRVLTNPLSHLHPAHAKRASGTPASWGLPPAELEPVYEIASSLPATNLCLQRARCFFLSAGANASLSTARSNFIFKKVWRS